MDKHCKKYLKELKYEDAKIIFKAVSGMLDLKANYKTNTPTTGIVTCAEATMKKTHSTSLNAVHMKICGGT